MRSILALCLLAAGFVCTGARADQNPSPTNVGLYNYSTFTVGLVSTETFPILPRNPYRAGLFIQNQGSVSVVIKPGSMSTGTTDGMVLTAGSSIQFNPVPVDAIYGASASSTAKIVMIEYAK